MGPRIADGKRIGIPTIVAASDAADPDRSHDLVLSVKVKPPGADVALSILDGVLSGGENAATK